MSKCPDCGAENPAEARFCIECASRLDEGKDPFIGTVIDKRYEVLEKIAEGGMGVVYRANHTRIDKDIALKILHPELARDRKLLARFESEAKTVAKLSHKNIVQVHDTGQIRDTYYIAMDFVDGEDLVDILESRGRLPVEEAFAVASQVAEGLAYAHERGILHRDIKPANIIIDNTGRAVITDFGIAKAIGSKGQTTTGTSIGTPEYMSLEQIKGDELDGRTDFYSLGVVLYEMLTGISPFRSESGITTLAKVLNEAPEPIERLRPDLPGWAMSVANKAMAKERDERYGSAVEFLNAVREGMEGGSMAVPQPSTPVVKIKLKTEKRAPRPSSAPAVAVMSAKRKALVATISTLIVVGIVITGILIFNSFSAFSGGGSGPKVESPSGFTSNWQNKGKIELPFGKPSGTGTVTPPATGPDEKGPTTGGNKFTPGTKGGGETGIEVKPGKKAKKKKFNFEFWQDERTDNKGKTKPTKPKTKKPAPTEPAPNNQAPNNPDSPMI